LQVFFHNQKEIIAMKTRFTLILSMLLCLALSVCLGLPATAAPVTEQLLQQPYTVTLGEEIYLLSFSQGPFGPGINGTAELTGGGQTLSFPYRAYESGLITIEGLCDFYFAGEEIVWVMPAFLVLMAQTE
jgi:hypothetical protein